jgi:hypothetical protein
MFLQKILKKNLNFFFYLLILYFIQINFSFFDKNVLFEKDLKIIVFKKENIKIIKIFFFF